MDNMPNGCRYPSDLDQYAAMNPAEDDEDVVLAQYCPKCSHLLKWYLASNYYEARCYFCGAIYQNPYPADRRTA